MILILNGLALKCGWYVVGGSRLAIARSAPG